MFVGHLAIALTAKRIESRVSLGTWVLAASLADLLAFPLLILGIEHFAVEPGTMSNRVVGQNIAYSHSLLTVWYGTVSAGMDPQPIKAGVGGMVIFSFVVAWAYSTKPPARITLVITTNLGVWYEDK